MLYISFVIFYLVALLICYRICIHETNHVPQERGENNKQLPNRTALELEIMMHYPFL
jgi:hypothetical protein